MTHNKLKATALLTDRTMSAVLRIALDEYVVSFKKQLKKAAKKAV